MIVLGRLIAPFGVKGWMHLHPFGDDPESWGRMSDWWLSPDPDAADWRVLHPEAVKPHSDGWIAKLLGIDGREGAEGLSKLYVAAPREILPPPADEEFYWADLVGLNVVNEAGLALGKIASLIETGANQVLVVKDGTTERLLPFVSAVVKQVDPASGTVRVAWDADW